MQKYFLLFLSVFFLNSIGSKEVLYEGDYFSSERDLANHLYFKQEYKILVRLTLDSIEKKRSCDFIEPFIEFSLRAAYQFNDFELLNFLYISSKRCGGNNHIIKEIYLKFLIEIEEYEKSYKILETLDRSSQYFVLLENRILKESGHWKYVGDLGTSLTRNSNVNNGFTANEIDIYGMTFEVSDDAYPLDDIGFKYTYSGTIYRYVKKTSQLRLKTYITGENYSGSLADRYSPFFSSDYILSKKDMISFSYGGTYWNKNAVYKLRSFSYTRKLTGHDYLKMLKLSFGNTKSPLNTDNNSRFFSVKGFFNIRNDLYIDLEYINNETDFGFSTYTGYSSAFYKLFEVRRINMIPFIELERRFYGGEFLSYGKKRSYRKTNLGLTFTLNQFKDFKFKFSTDLFESNIPIFDNKINIFELEYSF